MYTVETLGDLEKVIGRLLVEEATEQRHPVALSLLRSDPNRRFFLVN